jgi:hypothetical protein
MFEIDKYPLSEGKQAMISEDACERMRRRSYSLEKNSLCQIAPEGIVRVNQEGVPYGTPLVWH